MQYPHWLMVAGAVLVVLGSAGLVFRKSRAESAEDDLEHDVAPPQLRSRPTGRLPEFLDDDLVKRTGFEK
jgi:LPXTG-motif cell wall-anchored protein